MLLLIKLLQFELQNGFYLPVEVAEKGEVEVPVSVAVDVDVDLGNFIAPKGCACVDAVATEQA